MAIRRRDLRGATALVTGGGTGIGRAIASALAQRGAAVMLCGRRHAALAAAAEAITAAGGRAALTVCDVTDPAARRELLNATRTALGPLDILVNNAGLLASGSLLQLTGGEIDQAFATNLAAPVDLTRLALPDLMQTRGSLVFVGSTASFVPLPYAPLYSGAKAGLHAFCTALRHELAPLGVHLLEAFPPTTATAMTAAMGRKAPAWLGRPQSAAAAGSRIVAALEAGGQEVQWGAGERLLIAWQRLAPRLLARLLATQRRRFSHAMTPERGNGPDA